jgi:hypothetical protein
MSASREERLQALLAQWLADAAEHERDGLVDLHDTLMNCVAELDAILREDASPAPDAWQPVLQEAIDMAAAQREAASPAAPGRCPYCSFDPTTLNDYCPAHRPKES